MATYKVVQPYVAPLLLQLTVPSNIQAVIKRIAVNGVGSTGKSSRIYVYRPSVPGTGTGTAIALDRASGSSACTAITSFASVPSLPLYQLIARLLPITIEWGGDPPIVVQGGSLVVFQDCQNGYGASAELEWEESPADY